MGDEGESGGQLLLHDPLRQRGLDENGSIGQKLGASCPSVDLAKAFHRPYVSQKKEIGNGISNKKKKKKMKAGVNIPWPALVRGNEPGMDGKEWG